MPEVVCSLCRSVFKIKPYRIGTAKYCSLKCHNKAMEKIHDFVCVVCGAYKSKEDFYVDRSKSRGFLAACKACCKERHKNVYRRSPPKRYSELKGNARKRGFAFDISFDDYVLLLWGAPCMYCGDQTNGGVDRLNNEPFYSLSNAVPCCGVCNSMKSRMTSEQFFNRVEQIARRMGMKQIPISDPIAYAIGNDSANAAIACNE
jgi:hypothetical protein